MSYEFEGKEYPTASAVKREWFPHRSDVHVRRYLGFGCKTMKEVVDMETKVEAEGRRKSLVGSRKSPFGGRTKNGITPAAIGVKEKVE